MLVLSRKRDEKILVGEKGEIVLTVLEIRGDKVRLGIQADKSIPIHRQETWDAIHMARDASGRRESVCTEDLPAIGKDGAA